MSVLCKDCSKNRWYPCSIDKLDKALAKRLNTDKGVENVEAIRRNISYNIQYLQYLDITLKELDLSSVLFVQTYKTFIITGISIIEALFYFIIKERKLQKQTKWRSIKKVTTNEIISDEKIYRFENELFEKLKEYYDEEMTFDSMIKKVEDCKLLGIDHKVYGRLKYLRKLRNKVHIHAIDGRCDTDYNSFNVQDYRIMKEVLYELLAKYEFCSSPDLMEIYDFLKY